MKKKKRENKRKKKKNTNIATVFSLPHSVIGTFWPR